VVVLRPDEILNGLQHALHKSFSVLAGWLVVAMIPCCLVAQSLPLQYITTGDGLSQGMAYALVQDAQGFIWAGTKDGLNRYDGYSFRVFRHDPFDTLTLADNRIILLHVDRSERIWVAMESGLDLFDPARE